MSTLARSLIWIYTIYSVLRKLYPSSIQIFLFSSPSWDITQFNRLYLAAPCAKTPLLFPSSPYFQPSATACWNYWRFHCSQSATSLSELSEACRDPILDQSLTGPDLTGPNISVKSSPLLPSWLTSRSFHQDLTGRTILNPGCLFFLLFLLLLLFL